jgi:hypothetical protein
LWGVPPNAKRHVVARGGHDVPFYTLAQESFDWLDRYLGPPMAA